MDAGIVECALDGIEKMPWAPSTWARNILSDGRLLRESRLRPLRFNKARLLGYAIARGQSNGSLNPEFD